VAGGRAKRFGASAGVVGYATCFAFDQANRPFEQQRGKNMKYSILSTTLSLALGGGLAWADAEPADPYAAQPQQPATPQHAQPAQQAQPMDEAGLESQLNAIQSVDLLFDTDSAQLKAGAFDQLKTLARWAKCNAKGAVILEGHADPRGTQAHNLALSGQRAATVRAKLIGMGVPSERIVVTVYGENGPKRPTFAEDRRVTVRATSTPIQPTAISAQK
jgi:peptidoglycan-associated lipoprotein